MSVRRIKAGTTDVSVVIRIVDSTDGTPETGVVFNTSGIDLWYRREGAVSVDITEADLATPALTDAHADGGFLHINDGWYRLDLPDAACAAGVTGVQIGGTVTGMVVLAPYIELVSYDPYDGTRLGLTALPNAAADAAGGLPISDAGGLDLDAQITTKINAILADTGTDGVVVAAASKTGYALSSSQTFDLTGDITGNLSGSVGSVTGAVGSVTGNVGGNVVGSVASVTGNVGGNVSGSVASVTGNVGGNVTGSVGSLATQAKADVNAECDAAISDASLATSSALATVDANVDTMVLGIITGAAAAGTLSTTQATTDLTGYANDQLIGRVLIWTSGDCDGEATTITDYASSGGKLTFDELTTAPSASDSFKVV